MVLYCKHSPKNQISSKDLNTHTHIDVCLYVCIVKKKCAKENTLAAPHLTRRTSDNLCQEMRESKRDIYININERSSFFLFLLLLW